MIFLSKPRSSSRPPRVEPYFNLRLRFDREKVVKRRREKSSFLILAKGLNRQDERRLARFGELASAQDLTFVHKEETLVRYKRKRMFTHFFESTSLVMSG